MPSDKQAPTILVSADSHVTELPSVWKNVVDERFWGEFDALRQTRGTDPALRGSEMDQDGVLVEVLYPTLGLKLFSLEDPDLQERAFHAYNEWLASYCAADPRRLIGIGLIPCYRPDAALREMSYCAEVGFRGVMVWETPHPDLPFTSPHYDPIWEAAQELELPVSLHILSGFNYSRTLGDVIEVADPRLDSINRYRDSVNVKLSCTTDSVLGLIFGGALGRFPRLRVVVVENEMSWVPFFLDQWDYYYRRYDSSRPLGGLEKPPSVYFDEQVSVTFFHDPWAGHLLQRWGQTNVMWSNDFPHGNSTWPTSRDYVAEVLAGLDAETTERVLWRNCVELYRLDQKIVTESAAAVSQ